ncbi:hypothetical protein ACTGJ9_036115 [Bradyrhizobium sp. RDM12]
MKTVDLSRRRDHQKSTVRHAADSRGADEDNGMRFFRGLLIGGPVGLLLWAGLFFASKYSSKTDLLS